MSKRLGGIIGCEDKSCIVQFFIITVSLSSSLICLKKNLNAPKPSEHPPVRGKKCFVCPKPRVFQNVATPFFLWFLTISSLVRNTHPERNKMETPKFHCRLNFFFLFFSYFLFVSLFFSTPFPLGRTNVSRIE